MNVKEILQRAILCDEKRRHMEAQDLYKSGIEKLMELVQNEEDSSKKKAYMERIREYISRLEQIKDKIFQQATQGVQEKHLQIVDDASGNGYEELFGEYLNDDCMEILVEEPYLREKYQFYNFLVFLELVVKKCPNLKYIRLVTKKDEKPQNMQEPSFQQLTTELSQRKITLCVIYENTLHDRKIVLSNGYIIKIGRGLHFYKPSNSKGLLTLGMNDYYYRKCLQTDVDIWRVQ